MKRALLFCSLLGLSSAIPTFCAYKAPSLTYQGRTATFSVDSSRCLYMLLTAIAKQYNWSLTYEDALITYQPDMIDLTSPSYHPKDPEDRSLIPRGGPLEVSYQVPGAGQPPPESDAPAIIRAILSNYEKQGYPGRYRLNISSKKVFEIVPYEIKNGQGVIQAAKPYLDTPVRLQIVKETNADDATTRVAKEAGRATNMKLSFGSVAINALFNTPVEPIDVTKPARELIDDILLTKVGFRSWVMLCGPLRNSCALSIIY